MSSATCPTNFWALVMPRHHFDQVWLVITSTYGLGFGPFKMHQKALVELYVMEIVDKLCSMIINSTRRNSCVRSPFNVIQVTSGLCQQTLCDEVGSVKFWDYEIFTVLDIHLDQLYCMVSRWGSLKSNLTPMGCNETFRIFIMYDLIVDTWLLTS